MDDKKVARINELYHKSKEEGLTAAEKKEQQEKPEARSSLKERLAAKQKEAAQGNNKDTKELEKSKNSHREM